MLPNSMNDLFQFLSDLLTTHAATFQALGLNLFRSFALILIVWFGAKSALSSASGGPGFRFDHFAQLLLTIAFGFAMITYYTQPIPGFGVSFHSLITNEGLSRCLAFIFRKDKQFAMWLAQQEVPSSPAIAVHSEQPAPKTAHRKEKNGAVQGRLAITEEVSK